MHHRISFLCAVVALATMTASCSTPAIRTPLPASVYTASSEGPGDYWRGRMATFDGEKSSIQPGGVVMVGDSLTERFPNLDQIFTDTQVLNRGIGGERIDHIATRIDSTITAHNPERIFLLCGINDILYPVLTTEQRMENYSWLVAQLQTAAPDATITLQTVLPTSRNWAGKNAEVLEFNDFIRELALARNLPLIDLHPLFTDHQGELAAVYTNDGVHLNEAGYAVWAEALLAASTP